MKEYLTSLDVKQDKLFFYTEQEYSPGIYKDENNFDYDFKLYNPRDKEFLAFCNILKINKTSNPRNNKYVHKYVSNIKYISRVPIIVKIEENYFQKGERVIQLAKFINNLIQLYEYFNNDFGIPKFQLDGRQIMIKAKSDWKEIDYSDIHSINFYSVLKESIVDMEAPDELMYGEVGQREPLKISWKLFIDGVTSLYEGNLRQAVINCTSAIEVEIFEPIHNWFLKQTIRNSKDLIKNLMYEISNPLRLEIYLKQINPEPFKIYTIDEVKDLCKSFEKLNRIRNKVAHHGYFPNLDETKNALEVTGKLLRALWVFEDESDYNELKIR